MNLLPLDDPGRLALAHRWLAAPASRQWLCFGDSPEPLSLAALKVMTQRRQHVLRAFTDERGRPVGVVALGDIQRLSRSATIWCVLGEMSLAGRGYGTEAMRRGLALGFGELDLASISFGQGMSVTTVQLATAMSAIANGTVRPTGTLSARVPAIGIVSIAPMPCGAISRPAFRVDSPPTCRK